jgi:hypothetical protein
VIIEERHWRNPWAVTDEAADFLQRRTDIVETLVSTRLMVFTWRRGNDAIKDDCRAERFLGGA